MQLRDIPKIRYEKDEDGSHIARGRRNPYRKDFLCEDTGRSGGFGVYIERESKYGLTIAIKQYEAILPKGRPIGREQIGDYDAILWFTTTDPEQIPAWFKKCPALARNHGFNKK